MVADLGAGARELAEVDQTPRPRKCWPAAGARSCCCRAERCPKARCPQPRCSQPRCSQAPLLPSPAAPSPAAPSPRHSQPRGRPPRPVGGAGQPPARHHAALHPAAPPAAPRVRRADGADQRQRLRRAHRLPGRRRAGAAGRDRRRVPRPRPGHPHQDRRLRRPGLPGPGDRAAPLPRLRPRAAAGPGHLHPARAGLRGRAQEHVLPGPGHARVRLPAHRRPGERRDAGLVHRGDRALPAAVRH